MNTFWQIVKTVTTVVISEAVVVLAEWATKTKSRQK